MRIAAAVNNTERYRRGEPRRPIRVPEKVRIESKKQNSEIPCSPH
jgi:hypothetical protein